MRSKMDLISGYKGVVGLMFGNDDSTSSDASYVERLLDRINNGTKAEDRRTALTELQSVVAESHGAQLAFGAMGFPVMISVLKEDRDDLQMVRGALEVLLGALTPLNYTKAPKNEVQPATMNADLLSREADSTSLLLGLLSEDEFYIRFYTLQLLTALLNNSPNRLQEVILATPGGITRLMDMILDREVIRNEALLLLTYLTREAEEIQKIVVFDNAFEKIFGIITEEGGSDGGVVVQDCLELLKNVLRKNASNQTLLRETMGFDPVISLLKLRGTSYSFSQQKTINVLSAVETINILISGSETEPANISNFLTNKTVLVQKGVIEDLLMLGVESHRAPVAVHCAALRCIGDLIAGNTGNRDAFANKVVGDDSEVEPVINAILKIIMRTSSIEEFVAADYVLKKFCENFPDGQTMMACTLIPQPDSSNYDNLEEEMNMSFGSILLRGLTANENDGDLEICGRSASVLSHILVDNVSCKDRALKVELEVPVQTLGGMEPLMHRMVKYLALASSLNGNAEKSNGKGYLYVEQMILKLLVTWLADCPRAVQCFLDARPHLTYLMDLVSNRSATTCTKCLAAILLGECVLYNECSESSKDAFSIADSINQKIGLTTYFSMLDEMVKGSIFSSTGQSEKQGDSMSEIQDGDGNGQSNQDHPILGSLFDAAFIALVNKLDSYIREKVVFVYSHPNTNVANVPADLEQHSGESDGDYISRLKSFVQKQCSEIQDLIRRNTSLVEDLTKPSPGNDKERGKLESLVLELEERVESLKDDKEKAESDLGKYKNLAGKLESDLKSLSDGYSRMNMEVETARAEGREEAEKESETELSDLLVCLGQEQSKVERLSARLAELGEDVDLLIQGVGDDSGLANNDDSEDAE